MQVGDHVRVLAPFDVHFPGVYTVDSVSLAGAFRIYGDREFDEKFLEVTKDDVTDPSPSLNELISITIEARVAALENMLVSKNVATKEEVIAEAYSKARSGDVSLDEVKVDAEVVVTP